MHSIGIGQRRVAKEYPWTVHVQLFLVCRMGLQVSGEISLAADGLPADIAVNGGLNRMGE
jgi:hypothetical protein